MWGEWSLGKKASVMGKPLCTDECTANKLRVYHEGDERFSYLSRIMREIGLNRQWNMNGNIPFVRSAK